MPKDLKIGMIIGVVLLIVATLVISFLSEGSLKSRLKGKYNKESATKMPASEKIEESTDTDGFSNDDENHSPLSSDTIDETTEKIHIVADGETLNDLADKYFGNPMMTNKIVDANPQIPDSFELKAGMKIKIPD